MTVDKHKILDTKRVVSRLMANEMYKLSSILLNLIVHQYFKNFQCIFYLIENDYSIVSQIVPAVIINTSYIDGRARHMADSNSIDFNKFCQAFIIQSENPTRIFDHIEEQFLNSSTTIYKYNVRKYLFLMPNLKEIDRLLTSSHLDIVSNVLVITWNGSNCIGERHIEFCNQNYNLWTHNFVSKTPKIGRFLDRWFPANESFLYGNNLYPNKIRNARGKIFKVSTYTLSPYTVLGDSLEQSYGVDMKLILEYVRKYNFTPLLIVDPNKDWGLPYGNQTKTGGTVGQVVDGYADIAVGGLVYWPSLIFDVDTTSVYYACTIKCLVPRPGLLSGWKLPFRPFSSTLWIILLLSLFMTIAILYVSASADTYRQSSRGNNRITRRTLIMMLTFNIIGIYLTQAGPRQTRYKLIISLVLLLSLHFEIVYNSGLASIMTRPFHAPPINTVEDIIEHKLKVGTTSIPGYANIIIYDEKEKYQQFDKLLFEANQSSLLRMLSNPNRMGLLIDKTLVGNFAISDYSKSEILSNSEIMKQDILKMYIVAMVRKHSVLLPSFNKLAERVFESGLTQLWDQEAIHLTSSERIQKMLKMQEAFHKVPEKLEWIQIEGAYGVLCTGFLLSLIVFICEILLPRFT